MSYLIFGIIQESILKGTYENNQKFTFILSIVLFLCFFNSVVSKSVLIFRQTHRDTTSSMMYIYSSLTYVCAMLTSNYALEFVSYPMQVLSKSIKPVPVMILGVVVARKRYPLAKYFYVLLIVLGVILFMYKEPKEETSVTSESNSSFGIGEISLVISLICDGLTGGIQDKIRDKHQAQAYHMMYSMNIWSCLWTSMALIFTGELNELIPFLQTNPSVLPRIFLLGLTGAVGQNFIFLTIEWFGPLTCAIFTTTRKFFTILCSVLIFGNLITFRQICGTFFVFFGLLLDQVHGKKRH